MSSPWQGGRRSKYPSALAESPIAPTGGVIYNMYTDKVQDTDRQKRQDGRDCYYANAKSAFLEDRRTGEAVFLTPANLNQMKRDFSTQTEDLSQGILCTATLHGLGKRHENEEIGREQLDSLIYYLGITRQGTDNNVSRRQGTYQRTGILSLVNMGDKDIVAFHNVKLRAPSISDLKRGKGDPDRPVPWFVTVEPDEKVISNTALVRIGWWNIVHGLVEDKDQTKWMAMPYSHEMHYAVSNHLQSLGVHGDVEAQLKSWFTDDAAAEIKARITQIIQRYFSHEEKTAKQDAIRINDTGFAATSLLIKPDATAPGDNAGKRYLIKCGFQLLGFINQLLLIACEDAVSAGPKGNIREADIPLLRQIASATTQYTASVRQLVDKYCRNLVGLALQHAEAGKAFDIMLYE